MPAQRSMTDISGDFEIHLTVSGHHADGLAGFAEEHGLKFTHILLDRGRTPSQPMLTLTGSGPLARQRSTATRWTEQLRAADMLVTRVKIEAAPWCAGVPVTDADAARQPPERYFEHHVKLLLPAGVDALLAIAELARPHDARVSRNARRTRADGRQERFVTQRCHRVGLATAGRRLDQLVDALRDAGWEVAAVEREYVVFDSHLELDVGWFTGDGDGDGWTGDGDGRDRGKRSRDRQERRHAPRGGPGYPATYQPLPALAGVRQRAAFDPALKQHPNAYRAGEPTFTDPVAGQRWRAARRAALRHLVDVVAGTRWAEHLVLRGSVALAAWFGAAAREPGDLDFVVTPFSLTINSPEARELLDGILSALRERPGAGLDPERGQVEDIWTYERADGQRLVLPFTAPDDVAGFVQVDLVFNEHLPVAPTTIRIEGVDRPVRAATAELSLAWKLMWLATDAYPQGKDLYDAVLLAEHTTVDLGLVRDLLRPELGAEADAFEAESVLAWRVDWDNFAAEYPGVAGTVRSWQRRLAVALDRAWTTH